MSQGLLLLPAGTYGNVIRTLCPLVITDDEGVRRGTTVEKLASPLLRVFSGQGIVVVDLRRWLPDELVLDILTVQGTARTLHVWFGAGSLANLPGRGPRLLPAEGD